MGHGHGMRGGWARMAMRRSDKRLDSLFASADTNKDGKLTKDEFANFMWKRIAKPDAQSVTKEDLKTFAKERMTERHAARTGPHDKRPARSAKPESKAKDAQPKPKVEPKAEAKPATAVGTAAVGTAVPTAPSKAAIPVQATAPKDVHTNVPVNKSSGVFKADAGATPAKAPKDTGPKIGTSATSGGVKAALFAARR
jgi:hypothetical protein